MRRGQMTGCRDVGARFRGADRCAPARAARLLLPDERIATNVCLTALESGPRRPLPAGLVGRSDDPYAPLSPNRDIAWLEPFPDAWSGNPAVVAEQRDTLRLTFVAALQVLSARQRRTLPVAANGQLGFAAYSRDEIGGFRAHSRQILTTGADRLAHNVVFADTALFGVFNLPLRLPV